MIATVDYLALSLGPALARALQAEAPDVRLAFFALEPESIVGSLAEGSVHLYVGVRGETERALATRTLHEEALCVVMDPHPRRETGSIVERGLAELGRSRVVAVEVPYFALVPDLLAGSALLATVPSRIAARFAHTHGLVVRDVPLALPRLEICMAWHPAFAADPSGVWLRELVARVENGSMMHA